MLNIMLVDDDFPVLEYLLQAVPWCSLGMQVQGCYENGLKALAAAEEQLPDILITDIGMPHMNGLELIQKMKELQPRLKVAILSCHNEFSYAQQAVRLQVDDYILKETIEIESVVALLQKLAAQLKEMDKESGRINRLQQMKNESAYLLMDKFMNALLYHPPLFPERLAEQAKDNGIDFSRTAYIPVVCIIDRYEEAKKRFVSADNFTFAIGNVIEELTQGPEKVAIFRHSSGKVILLFPADYMKHRHYGVYEREQMLGNIQRALTKFLRIHVSFVIGGEAGDEIMLRESILQLLAHAVEARFYSKPGVLICTRPAQYSSEDLYIHYATALNQFIQIAIEQAADRVGAVISCWADFIAGKLYEPKTVREWFLKIMMDLQLKFKSLQHFRSDYTLEVLHQSVLNAESLDQLLEMVASVLNSTFPVMDKVYMQNQRKEITDAQLYVMRAISRRVTQEEVADYLHLNPSYFSRLFKKETGETFVEFTTRTKMEKAKELIDQTASTVEELAEKLGYDNKSYFLKCFKAFTGFTPSEYARKQRSNQI
ncbi:response regulator transcription factor [Paenibacillus sp. IITD108]|uniref:response regulator transcription factor n=1 Tax=Paenibacillus sp. IITD108 TaxID=3116649 RepID=UPI002F3F024E